MKKLMVLMFVSFLSLAGCGGGGGGEPAAVIPDESPSVSADVGRITVNFEPQETARALVSSTERIRNHARLVVRQYGLVEIPGAPIYVGEEVCTTDADGEEVCSREISGYEPSTFENKELANTKKISDAALNALGAGTVSIEVPPGAGYTLEVLTYFSDKTGQAGAISTPPTGLNFMMQYGKNHDGSNNPTTFTIQPGIVTNVPVTLTTALAQLVIPVNPVLANTTYQVSFAAKSAALRDAWKVRQTQDEADLGNMWFTASIGDLGVSGTGAITLTAPYSATANGGVNAPNWQLWHHGQFFISDHLLGRPGDDAWSKWTFGTNNAGLLNPLGSVNVVFTP